MIGNYRHRVTFQDPGPALPDGKGGYTHTWAALVPAEWKVEVAPAAARDLERIAPGSVITTAAYVVRGRNHAGVSTKTRMLHQGRTLAITGKRTSDDRGLYMELAAVEMVTP